jgi:deazaflavin-dependent oxidoreductase (nitroreductase family)
MGPTARLLHRGMPDYSLFGDAHIAEYERTDGEVGHVWNGATCLVLTTTGRQSGQPRKFALIYGRDADRYLLVASKGGAPDHPGWYKNLVAHPEVRIQVQADVIDVVAATADADEKARLWPIMVEQWPAYDEYQAKTDRDIPLVVLTPVS